MNGSYYQVVCSLAVWAGYKKKGKFITGEMHWTSKVETCLLETSAKAQ